MLVLTTRRQGNYGGDPGWDWLCGTDQAWRRYIAANEGKLAAAAGEVQGKLQRKAA